jgi:ribonucleotide reductase alpha subunit
MIKIEKLKENIPVYDITVDGNHNFFGNDILVHNCSEIMEVTDAKTTAICTLTSIPVQKFVIDGEYNFEELGRVTRSITKSLNIAIDVNEYSTEEGRKGGLEQRALGIGIQGLADVFALLKLKFTSEESRKLNKDIFETIYFNALRQSCDLAKETGLTYDGYEGSPLSEGIFQWQMWGLKDEDLSGMFDWKQLRKDIKKYGVRNSLVTTCPPTASCQVIDTRIHTENGVKSFKEILIMKHWKNIINNNGYHLINHLMLKHRMVMKKLRK